MMVEVVQAIERPLLPSTANPSTHITSQAIGTVPSLLHYNVFVVRMCLYCQCAFELFTTSDPTAGA
jgi:hypothetical protein